MKKGKLFLLTAMLCALIASLCTFAVACDPADDHTHEWGAWTWVTEPTETAAGVAKHECTADDGADQTVDVPALTDTSVWTLTTTDATHTTAGVKTYTSEYGTVEVEIPKTTEHTWGEWTITVEPTLTEGGRAERVCTADDEGKDSKDLPALTDTTVWTKDEAQHVDATHTADGKDVYTSEYGTVEVAIGAIGHSWSEWTITVDPTLTEAGSATRACTADDNGTETATVPALSDSSWVAGTPVEATYEHGGYTVYTHATFGEYVLYTSARKVAPYEGKTYHSFSIDASSSNGYLNRKVSATTSWTAQSITVDETGTSTVGTGMPFTNGSTFKFAMVNDVTGEISITETDRNGTVKTPVKAYIDMETGIIVMPYSTFFDYIHVLITTGEYGNSDSAEASAWEIDMDYKMALTYTYGAENVTHNIYVDGIQGPVYFGVSFTGIDGETVVGGNAYNAPYLYVTDKNGNELAAYGYNGEELVVLDGYEGAYNIATISLGEQSYENYGTVFLSGYGTVTLTLNDGEGGTEDFYGVYTLSNGDILIVVEEIGASFWLTIDGEYSVTLNAALATIALDVNGHGSLDNQDQLVFIGIAAELPTPEDDQWLFLGWYLDADGTQSAANENGEYVFTESITVYAKWAAPVNVTVKVGVNDEGTEYSIALNVNYQDYLNALLVELDGITYQEGLYIDLENSVYFGGWYIVYPDEPDNPYEIIDTWLVDTDSEGALVYAEWIAIPVYYGTYKGTELWNASSGNSSTKSMKIDMMGNITGDYTGTVTSYDKTTQLITWTKSDNSTNYFFFDEESGVICLYYSGTTRNTIGTDFNIYSKYSTTNKFSAHYGVKAVARGAAADSSRSYYAHFVTVPTADGSTQDILVYDTYIYSNITITDAYGDALTSATVANSKTLVVIDNTTGEVVLKIASKGNTFNANNDTVDLDSFYGKYTGETELALDGAGNVKYGEETGTYTVIEGNKLAIRIGDPVTAYYEAEVDVEARTYTIDKPMVTITIVSVVDLEVMSLTVNKNVPVQLTTPVDPEGVYIFRGWYTTLTDGTYSGALDDDGEGNYSYTPASDVTLYAKWESKVILTVHYNDGASADGVFEYAQGETATLETPKYAGHKFLGWYTTEELTDGSEWENGSAIEANTEIWAKWGDAPIYSQTYYLVELGGANANGGTTSWYVRTTKALEIDPDGNAPSLGTWPFNGALTVTDNGDGSLVLTIGTTKYLAFVDSASGLIVMNDGSGLDTAMDGIVLFSNYESQGFTYADNERVSSSYWNAGMTRTIVYTVGENVFKIFIHNNKVYFGVSFKDALVNGNDVAGADCYQSLSLYVFDSEGNEIARFGYNGTTMIELDGFEGTYEGALGDLVLNGVDVANLGEIDGTYYVTDKESGLIAAYIGDGDDMVYYDITLNLEAHTYEAVKTMVTITFVSDYGFASEDAKVVQYNKNVPVTLPELVDEINIFNGFYTDDDYTTPVTLSNGKYTPADDATIYVQWLTKHTVTVHYNKDGIALPTIYSVGHGNTLTIAIPTYTDGQVVEALYTSADFAEDTLWTNGSVVESDLDIYVKWMDAVAMYGSYTGRNVYNASSVGTGSGSYTLNVSAYGDFTGNFTGTLSSYDPVTGAVRVTTSSSYYEGAFDAYSGVMMFTYSSGKDLIGQYDINIFIPSSSYTGVEGAGFNGDYVNKIITVKGAGDYQTTILVYNGRIYGDITLSGQAGITAANFNNYDSFAVYQGETFIIGFSKGADGKLVGTDGLEGDYTQGEGGEALGSLTLDGAGNLTVGEKAGIYTMAAAENTVEVYVGSPVEAYYEIALNVVDKTYVATKPMVTISFVIEGGLTEEAITVNKNVPVALPVTETATHVVKGWYTDAELNTPVTLDANGMYVPTASVTLYSEALEKVTLTIVYTVGGHSTQENATVFVASGSTPDLTAYIPGMADDGYVFLGWFEDEALSIPYTPSALTENKIIYCGWTEITYTVESTGSKVWTETAPGTWRANASADRDSIILKITFAVSGTFSFDYVASFSDSYDGIYAVLNQSIPHSSTGSRILDGTYNGSGTKQVTVEAGDVLYIEAYRDYSDGSSSDYAQVSNFQFVVG